MLLLFLWVASAFNYYLINFQLIVGSILLITFDGEKYKDFVPLFVLGSKFGISGSFNVVYLANGLFPPLYSSTTFGLCNFFARLASMLAP